MDIEEIKHLDMKELLSRHYGMTFRMVGREYVSLSPFKKEKRPSFFVRQAEDGHWLFKDFSSNQGGSIIDFVMLKENFLDVSKALAHIQRLIGVNIVEPGQEDKSSSIAKEAKQARKYDLKFVYSKIKESDPKISKEYLKKRGIAWELIEELSDAGILLHNHYDGHSYCCFAVFDRGGDLCCLDNHQIDGAGKFVLGKKSIFTRDWEKLGSAEVVFICEGIIDYLSVKTLEEGELPGIALLGNEVSFDRELLKNVQTVISALDGDSGGLSALMDLREQFPDKEISSFNFGRCNDPNEYLQELKAGKDATNLMAKEKLAIYRDYLKAGNKSSVALKWGINRTYMYELIKDCEELIVGGFSGRHRGRRPNNAPLTLEEATNRIAVLEEEKLHEAKEKERFYARSEFLKVRLKWAEKEATQYRDEEAKKLKKGRLKKQIKKKRKKKR